MPCGLHCAISGILAGGILGFGTADPLLFWFTSTAILLCGLVGCFFAFCKIQFISSCHWHISCLACARARPSRRGVSGVFGLFLFVLFGVFCFSVWLFFCFVVLFRFTLRFGHLDCVLVRALFRLPNAGIYRTLHNSFNGTNTVLRPGESREGEGRKKKAKCSLFERCQMQFEHGLRFISHPSLHR